MASTSRDNEGTFIQGSRNEFMSTFYSTIFLEILNYTHTLWREKDGGKLEENGGTLD